MDDYLHYDFIINEWKIYVSRVKKYLISNVEIVQIKHKTVMKLNIKLESIFFFMQIIELLALCVVIYYYKTNFLGKDNLFSKQQARAHGAGADIYWSVYYSWFCV